MPAKKKTARKPRKTAAEKLREELHLQAIKADINGRARGLTIGTAFGGTTEISMRGQAGQNLFCLMQPVEVVELIHQLAANVGCHIHILPRKDFASWRDWQLTEEELKHYRGEQSLPGVGHPPHVNDMAPHNNVGGNLPAPEEQAGVPLQLKQKETEHVVATDKAVNKRSSKRSRKSS